MHALGQGDVGHLEVASPRTQNGAIGRLLTSHDQHGGHHSFGLQGAQHRFRHQAFGHAGGCRRSQSVDANIVFLPFQ